MRTRDIAGLGFFLALALATAAPAARAQQLTRVAEVESTGGYTRFNDRATIWAETRAGRVRRGLILVERTFRGGAQPLVMTGTLGAAETHDLWTRVAAALPSRDPQVHAAQVNVDFPDTIVTYRGRYRQEVRASFASLAAIPPGIPLVSNDMQRFLDGVSAAIARTAAADLFVYDASGGRAGYRRTIRIAADGTIDDDVTYAAAAFAPYQYSKSGALTPDEVNALRALCARWSRLPAAFAGDPRLVDGIGIETTYTTFGIGKAVFAGDPASRPAAYQRILDKVEAFAAAIP